MIFPFVSSLIRVRFAMLFVFRRHAHRDRGMVPADEHRPPDHACAGRENARAADSGSAGELDPPPIAMAILGFLALVFVIWLVKTLSVERRETANGEH